MIFFLLGCFLGAAFFYLFYHLKKKGFLFLAREIIQKAETYADSKRKALEIELKETRFESVQQMNTLLDEGRKKMAKEKEGLAKREEKLENLMQLVERKMKEAEKKESLYKEKIPFLEGEEKKIQEELEKISSLSMDQAKALLFEKIEGSLRAESANLIRRITKEAQDTAEWEAKRIIATSINRMALPCVSDMTTATLALPSEEMKGRIIGREGRNIRALEQETGVNFLVDDTPGVVVISGFDPIRRHVAKSSLKELLQDGRIHPTRIVEVVAKAKENVEKEIKEYGEDAAMHAAVFNLHSTLLELLGKLHFRTSYGQQVLHHSLEVAHIMGFMAAELGLNIALAKRMGLLHDIGKALSHEKEGSHALVGHDIAIKYGESKLVANGIGCHHGEMPPLSIEAALVSAADAISGARLGARSDTIEQYVKRLHTLETLSSQYPGVEKAYALQAGREICVIVTPDIVDDTQAGDLAKKIAQKIEEEITYPGKIKVTVIREKKSVEYAKNSS